MGVFRFGGDYYGIRGNQTSKAYGVGGSVSESGGYRVHTFTTSGSIVFSSDGPVETLIVAGGGGTGYDVGGGGGAGGMKYVLDTSVMATNYNVVVGQGGASGQSSGIRGTSGGDSSIFQITSVGGGGGGSYSVNMNGLSGGSGGGGGGSAGASGGSGTSGQGNSGGAGAPSAHGGGGGGGAGSAGANGVANVVVDGGLYISNSITGISENYCGGGYGNNDGGAVYASGNNKSNLTIGLYGFGANGTGSPNNSPYSGTNGIIIVRYPT